MNPGVLTISTCCSPVCWSEPGGPKKFLTIASTVILHYHLDHCWSHYAPNTDMFFQFLKAFIPVVPYACKAWCPTLPTPIHTHTGWYMFERGWHQYILLNLTILNEIIKLNLFLIVEKKDFKIKLGSQEIFLFLTGREQSYLWRSYFKAIMTTDFNL